MFRPAPRPAGAAAALLLACTLLPGSVLAARKKTADFTHPDYASFQIRSIAVLPTSVLPPAAEASAIVDRQLERSLAALKYRWLSPSALRRSLSGGQAGAVDALVERLRRTSELDSTVKALGQAGVADAVLGLVVTTWERETIDFTMTGQSMTQIGLQAVLYSTRTGELLWSRRFLAKGEGPYHNPGDGSGVMGVKSGGFETGAPRTSTSLDPPTYEEVAAKAALLVRNALPAPPASPATPATPAP